MRTSRSRWSAILVVLVLAVGVLAFPALGEAAMKAPVGTWAGPTGEPDDDYGVFSVAQGKAGEQSGFYVEEMVGGCGGNPGFLFGMVTSAKTRPSCGAPVMLGVSVMRLVGRQDLACDADILAAGFPRFHYRLVEPGVAAHARQFHQHRQVDAGDHFDAWPLHGGDREIGWRTAEHVGEHHDTFAAIDAVER